jgi:hypothetical protein
MPLWWTRRDRKEPGRIGIDDALVQSVVLAYIITERSEGVTIPMLSLHFNAEFDQGEKGLAVERAVRELVSEGRLRMEVGLVVPRH